MQTQMKRWWSTTLLVGAGITYAVVAITAQGASRIQRGEALAPVPLNMTGLNPALVREGSYIVNAQGGCNDCHTVPSYATGGNPFFGEPELINAPCYLAGGADFGIAVSRNITPRANGLPANRTLEQFKELMHEGTDFAGGATPILQVMPWPVYGKMSDRELEAIYEFLRAIPSINPRPAFCAPPTTP
jgi:hypothetical protein